MSAPSAAATAGKTTAAEAAASAETAEAAPSEAAPAEGAVVIVVVIMVVMETRSSVMPVRSAAEIPEMVGRYYRHACGPVIGIISAAVGVYVYNNNDYKHHYPQVVQKEIYNALEK